jgi:FtsH-binding integral membrane protein
MYQQERYPESYSQSATPFVRETYRLLLYALLGIVGAGFLAYNTLPLAALLPVGIANFVLWIACGMFGWRRPTNVTLPLFTLVNGLFLGLIAHLYAPAVFLSAAVLTALAFTGLTLYVHKTRADFSYLTGFLSILCWVILGGALLSIFLPIPLMSVGLAALGVLFFGGWILYDTSQILQNREPGQTPGAAAFELLLDIIGLFRWLLRLLDQFR